MIDLTDAVIIGKGSERVCYQHPDDSNLCIKVRYRVKRSRDESAREVDYAAQLSLDKYDLPFALPIEWVKTTEGRGLVFPLIRDDDGQVSRSLLAVDNKVQFADIYDEFAESILTNHLSVIDLRLQNLVLQKKGARVRIVMIDGYGFTNDFLKYLFYLTKVITHIQTKRRLRRFKRDFFTEKR